MTRGFYIAGTGMLLQRHKMEVTTHNITNVETQGYKSETLVSRSFEDVLLERKNDVAVKNVSRYPGNINYGTRVDEISISFTQGNMEQSGNSTDLALTGDGFYVMQTEQGERLTRQSVFIVDVDGNLTDGDGNYLLGNQGIINVGSTNFSVNGQGDLFVNGNYVDTLRVMTVEDIGVLRKQGDNLYFLQEGEAMAANPANYSIHQGFMENSNVEIASEMVDMMTVYRAYEANQKILTMIDELTGKAVNDIAPVR